MPRSYIITQVVGALFSLGLLASVLMVTHDMMELNVKLVERVRVLEKVLDLMGQKADPTYEFRYKREKRKELPL